MAIARADRLAAMQAMAAMERDSRLEHLRRLAEERDALAAAIARLDGPLAPIRGAADAHAVERHRVWVMRRRAELTARQARLNAAWQAAHEQAVHAFGRAAVLQKLARRARSRAPGRV